MPSPSPAATASSAGEPLPSGMALTALDPAFRDDPYPILARLRREAPVHYDHVLKRWVFTRHADVHAILRDPELWTDPRKANPGTFTRNFLMRAGDEDVEPSMLLMDDPGHRRLRELVRDGFTPKAVERWRPRARALAERLVADLPEQGFDVIRGLADPLPTMVIAEMLGIDAARHGDFKTWSSISVVVGFNPAPSPDQLRAAEAAQAALDAFFREEIGRRRAAPGDDLISGMLRSEQAGDRLSEHEIVRQCNLLLVAGNVTTSDLIGNAVKALVDHPAEQARVVAEPGRISDAVDETLRFDTPVTNSGRIASRDLDFDGVKIARGESLSVSLAAGNRDPAVHPRPDAFELDRADKSTLAFGGGRHFCLGAHLARLEAAEALRALLGRFGSLSPAAGGHAYAAVPSFRGLVHLHVEPARD